MNGVLHKNYYRLHTTGGRSGPISILDLDAGSDQNFRNLFQVNVISRGRVTGNWSFPWHGHVWYYAFRPVPGTPFMIAVTVREDLVTGDADSAVEKMRDRVRTGIVVNAVICGFVLVLLVFGTNALNNRFAKPVNELRKLSHSWANHRYNEDIEGTMCERVSSHELKTIVGNFGKLLHALRFGNAEYHGGSADKELENGLKVLDILKETGNQRGLGVCYNNLANAASRSPATAAKNGVDTAQYFALAIDNAKELMHAKGPDGTAKEAGSTLALRLLNCALWHLNEKRVPLALQVLGEAINATYSPATLASIALAVSASASDAQTLANVTPPLVAAVSKAFDQANLQGGHLTISDAAWLGDLALACCNMGGFNGDAPVAWACYALHMIPCMKDKVLIQLALHLKAGQPGGVLPLLDQKLMPPVGPVHNFPAGPVTDARSAWVKMNTPDKVVVFLIDRTWTPILEASINATAMVFREHLNDGDQVGMFSLGES
jgi:hypothetical protein